MNGQEFLGLPSQEHRVLSFPASQSLHASSAPATAVVSTGITQLDEAVSPPTTADVPGSRESATPKGIPRGHVTEVFGPPGVGKTSLAMNAAVNVLKNGGKVVWIDVGTPLPKPRLKKIFSKALDTDHSSKTPEDLVENLIYFRAHSLPHLLALIIHPPPGFPPDDTQLLVIDAVSEPFPAYFPNPTELKAKMSQTKNTEKSQTQWLMNRKWNVTSELANSLVKMATSHRLAALLVNQTHTRIRGQPRATLCPLLAGGSWENNIYTRIVVFRDFPAADDPEAPETTHFAEVLKRAGKTLTLRLDENIVPFIIESDGLRGVQQQNPRPQEPTPEPTEQSSASQRKRKVDEIADSQDEDSDDEFGWDERGDDADLLEKD